MPRIDEGSWRRLPRFRGRVDPPDGQSGRRRPRAQNIRRRRFAEIGVVVRFTSRRYLHRKTTYRSQRTSGSMRPTPYGASSSIMLLTGRIAQAPRFGRGLAINAEELSTPRPSGRRRPAHSLTGAEARSAGRSSSHGTGRMGPNGREKQPRCSGRRTPPRRRRRRPVPRGQPQHARMGIGALPLALASPCTAKVTHIRATRAGTPRPRSSTRLGTLRRHRPMAEDSRPG